MTIHDIRKQLREEELHNRHLADRFSNVWMWNEWSEISGLLKRSNRIAFKQPLKVAMAKREPKLEPATSKRRLNPLPVFR